mgnify:CR=1 FL=1
MASNLNLLTQARVDGFDEFIIVNQNGKVCEGAVSNFVFRIDGLWVTPDLGAGVLPGIIRGIIISSGLAIEAEIDGCGGPWPFGSGPSTQAHDRALIHVVRAWGRGDECAELVEIARAAYVVWCGVPAAAPVVATQPTPLERTKAERSRRGRQMSLDLDDGDVRTEREGGTFRHVVDVRGERDVAGDRQVRP